MQDINSTYRYAPLSCKDAVVGYLSRIRRNGGTADSRVIKFIIESDIDQHSANALTLEDIPISLPQIQSIATSVSLTESLVELSLGNSSLTDVHMNHVGSWLSNNSTCLKVLNLSRNEIGTKGLKHLLQENLESLSILILSHNRLECHAGKLLAAFIVDGDFNLSTLDVGDNHLGDLGTSAIVQTYLHQLPEGHNNNKIAGEDDDDNHEDSSDDEKQPHGTSATVGSAAAVVAPTVFSSVYTLHLSGNQMTMTGLMIVIDFCAHSCSRVNSLELNNNFLDDSAAELLSDMFVMYNVALTTLDVRSNPITDIGMKILLNSVQSHSKVHTFRYSLSHLDASLTKFKPGFYIDTVETKRIDV